VLDKGAYELGFRPPEVTHTYNPGGERGAFFFGEKFLSVST
jgi:hypothetical protein